MTTVKRARRHWFVVSGESRTHRVETYDDDTGHGLAYCGYKVRPYHIAFTGNGSCKLCVRRSQEKREG